MPYKRFYTTTLFFLVAILGYLSYQIIKPFLTPIAWAVVFSIVFYPVYTFVLARLRWKSIAALATVVIILAVIVGPFSYFTFLLVAELKHLGNYLERDQLESLKTVMEHESISRFMTWLTGAFGTTEEELDRAIISYLSKFGRELIGQITQGVGNVMAVAVNFVFMLFAVFFMFRDGTDFLQKIRDYMPFSDDEKVLLTSQMRDIIISTIYGGVVVAIAQGIIGGVSFSLLGIPSPALWGFAISIASFIPLVGSFAVWGPAVIFLFATGAVAKGFILFLIGAFGISLVDNLFRPIIIGSRTKMHVMVILFSVLGGIQLFGLIGLIMGPLVVAIFISVIKIFKNIEINQERTE